MKHFKQALLAINEIEDEKQLVQLFELVVKELELPRVNINSIR